MKPFVLLLFLMFCHVRGQVQGGNDAEQGDFPYAVRVKSKYSNCEGQEKGCGCTGTIIHPNWVVTAAHCTETNRGIKIIAGDIWRKPSKDKEQSKHRKEYTATKMIQHPVWIKSSKKKEDFLQPIDIALLYFKDGITFNPWTQPITYLPAITPKTKDECKIMGWGKTSITIHKDGTEEQGDSANRLKYAKIKVHAVSGAQKFKDSKSNSWYSKLIVIKFETGGVRTLKGDSGGPLVCQDSKNEDVLCGVLSGSDTKSGVSLYSNFETHLKWISGVMSATTAEQNNQQGQQRQQERQQKNHNNQQKGRSPRHKQQKQQSQDQGNYFAAAVVTGLAGILFAYRRG